MGKVHKRGLLQLHKFDKRAIEILKSVKRLNDDEVMLLIVNEFEKHNITDNCSYKNYNQNSVGKIYLTHIHGDIFAYRPTFKSDR